MSDVNSVSSEMAVEVVTPLSFYAGGSQTRVAGHLSYCEATSPNLPPGRIPTICVLGVPKQLTYASFLADAGLLIADVEEIVSARTVGSNDRILSINFRTQESADNFHASFNQKPVSSVQGNFYQAYFVTVFRFEESVNAPTSCFICDEEHASHGVFTTLCDHTFHIKCMSSWHQIYCPSCRYELHEVPGLSSLFLKVARYMVTAKFVLKLLSLVGDVTRLTQHVANVRKEVLKICQLLATIWYKIIDLFKSLF